MREEFAAITAMLEEGVRQNREIPDDLCPDTAMASLEGRAMRLHTLFGRANEMLAQRLLPVLQNPTAADVPDLLELAARLYDHTKGIELDAGLMANIYAALLRYAEANDDEALRMRSIFWLGLYHHLYKPSNNDDTAYGYYAEALARLPGIRAAAPEDRVYILRCLCNMTQVLGDRELYRQELNFYSNVMPELQVLRQEPDFIPDALWQNAFMVLNLNTALCLISGAIEGDLPAAEVQKVYALVEAERETLLARREHPDYVMRYDLLPLQADFLLGRVTKLEAVRRAYRLIERCHAGECEDDPEACILDISEQMLAWLEGPVEGMEEEERRALVLGLARQMFLLLKKSSRAGVLSPVLPIMVKYVQVCGKLYSPRHVVAQTIDATALIHPPTCIHSVMVMHIAECLARAMLCENPGYFAALPMEYRATNEATLRFVRLCSLAHDIGKVALPDVVGQVTRSLTALEYEAVKGHVATGFELLYSSAATRPYSYVALLHHLHYDGKGGYPGNFELRAEHLPYLPVARIIMAADCLDAGTDFVGRSYASPKSLETVVEELRRDAGSMIDPVVAKLLEDEGLVEEIGSIIERERPRVYAAVYAGGEVVLDESEARLSYRTAS